MRSPDVQPVVRHYGERRPRAAGGAVREKPETAARKRVVVAIDGGRNSERVVRAGKRIADQRRAPWTVVHVETGRPGAAVRERIERAFRLVERLGGDAIVLRGRSVDAEIVAYARDHNATTIVIGRTRRRPLAGFFRQTFTQRLLRDHGDFEITIVSAAPAEAATLRGRWGAWLDELRGSPWRHYSYALIVVAICTAISEMLAFTLPLDLSNLSLVLLVGVLIVAVRTSLAPALVAAVLTSLAYNFLFIGPISGLANYPANEFIAVLLFLAAAIIGSNLAHRLRVQVAALRATNAQSQALLAFSKQLAEAPDSAAVRRAAVEAIAKIERVPTCLLTTIGRGGIELSASAPEPVALSDRLQAAANWAFEHDRPSGYLGETLPGVGWRFVPLTLEESRYGVLGVKFGELPIRPRNEQLLLLDALANQVTLTLARTELTSNLERARVAEETERLRSALLSSVSHDLRTPLASMIGSASTLRDLGDRLSETDKYEMLDAVLSEGLRLNRYIENLLDMTRLGDGTTLKLPRDWVTLADVVASALQRARDMLTEVHIVRDIPADLPLLYVNSALIEQALVNVIENAARFSPSGGEVRIAARQEGGQLLITVADQGAGIPKADRDRVFDMFFTGGDGDTGPHGSGLGLAICQGIIAAHGGSIEALPGPNSRGAVIAIRLPLIALPQESREERAHVG